MRSAGDQSARTGDGPVVEALRGEIDRLRSRLAEAERDAAAHASALLDVGRELSLALEPADLLARLASRAASLTRAGVAFVVLWDPHERRHRVEGVYGLDDDRAEAVRHAPAAANRMAAPSERKTGFTIPKEYNLFTVDPGAARSTRSS